MNKIETKIKALEIIKRGISNIIESIDSNEFTKELENEFDEFENKLQTKINNLNKLNITDEEINKKYHTKIGIINSVRSGNFFKIKIENEEDYIFTTINTAFFCKLNLPNFKDKVILGTLKTKKDTEFNRYNCRILKVIEN